MSGFIMIAEDEKPLNDMVSDYLRSIGYETMSIYNGLAVLEKLKTIQPILLILDLMLPGLDGIEVARKIRQDNDLPIVILTARAEEGDKLLGLEIGADDYVTKPFSMRELTARIRAVLRRSEKANLKQEERIVHGPFEMNANKRTVSKNGKVVDLTPAQFDFLHIMLKEPGRVFGRNDLIEMVSGYDYEGYERTVDTHVKNIRRAIEDDPAHPEYLVTVWGVGYKFEAV